MGIASKFSNIGSPIDVIESLAHSIATQSEDLFNVLIDFNVENWLPMNWLQDQGQEVLKSFEMVLQSYFGKITKNFRQ